MEQTPNAVQTEKHHPGFFTKFIGSGFFTGYAPFATGTVASAVALLFFLIPDFHTPVVLIPSTIILFLAGGKAAEEMEKSYGQDPSVVTVDEIAGMWLSVWFVAPSPLYLGIAFLIFRVLDILKPYPAQLFDRQKGGWNIMMDDVIAGIYTNIILQIAIRWF
ncbi:MAG: phosphatidylglycerophosphatase A [Ignavibacteriales bacterium]|nr:phosphatidylglycerophosphatase A [Ignavibacteriales bacterium]